MTLPKVPKLARTHRGYRMAELCRREGIDPRTGWRWVEKGVLKVSRLGPRTGVRVMYTDSTDEPDGDLTKGQARDLLNIAIARVS